MRQARHSTEFDQNLITKARERAQTSYSQRIENPSAAISFDTELIQRARERSFASTLNAKEAQSQKHQFNATQQENWSSTQNDKRNRIIRDLQFELASNSIVDLKKAKSNSLHRDAQVDGIAAFELCLLKNGLGGGDDEGGLIGISYENGEAFLERMEDRARKSFPADAEASKFVTRLKARTKEKKTARHEKERRKRKTAANQTISSLERDQPNDTATVNSIIEDDDSSNDDEVTMDVDSMQDKRRDMAEDSIRVFAEQSRMRHAESDDPKLSLKVLEAQRQRSKNKNRATNETCRELVLNLLSHIDYGADERCRGSGNHEKINDVSILSADLLDFIDCELGLLTESPSHQTISCVADLCTYDCWVPYAVLSANIGRWAFSTDSLCNGEKEGETASFEIESEERKESVPVMSKAEHFLESTQCMLEDFLEISCTHSSCSISLALSVEEKSYLKGGSGGMVLLLGGGPGSDLCCADILRTISWAGGSGFVEVWDVAAAIEVGRKLAPLLEGKTPSINFLALLEMFSSGCSSVFPGVLSIEGMALEALKVMALSSRAMKAATDIADAGMRILYSIHPVAAAPLAGTGGKVDGKNKVQAVTASFTDVTFGILLGQVLWLRGYIKTQYQDFLASQESSEAPCSEPHNAIGFSFAPLIIACRCVRADVSHAEADNVSFALAVDWFSQGGSREGLHDAGTDSPWKKLLRDAVHAESDATAGSGTKKGKDKAASKSKGNGVEAEHMGPSMISCILRMSATLTTTSSSQCTAELLGLDIPEPLVEGLQSEARLLVSSYSKADVDAFKKNHEDGEESGSVESVLVESATSSHITYLQLVLSSGHPDLAPSSDLHPTDAHSMSYSSGLSASETLLAILLHCTHCQPVVPISSPPLSSNKSSLEGARPTLPHHDADSGHQAGLGSVMAIMMKRRSVLSDSEQLWLLHISNTNTIDLPQACTVLHLIMECRAADTEMTGVALMAFGLSMHAVEEQFRSKEAEIISRLKVSDPRLKDICLRAQERLTPSLSASRGRSKGKDLEISVSKDKVNVVVSDCVCMLGDIIDDRHMTWIQLTAAHRVTLEESLLAFKAVAQRVSRQLAAALSTVHAAGDKTGIAVADLMESAQHRTMPWVLPHSGSKATRRAAEVRKDRLRSASLLLAASCGLSSDANSSTGSSNLDVSDEKEEVDPWRDFILLHQSDLRGESSDTGVSLYDSIAYELYAETLEKGISLLSALHAGVTHLQGQLEVHILAVQSMVINRYQFEHALLVQWTTALEKTLVARSGASDGYKDCLSGSRCFDVSDRVGMDMVSSKVGSGCIELEDLTLPLHSVRKLSEHLSHCREDNNELLTEDLCHDILQKAILKMEVSSFRPAWVQESRTKDLVRQVVRSSAGADGTAQSLPMLITQSAFVTSIVRILLLAAVPFAPQRDLIVRLGAITGGVQGKVEEGGPLFSFLVSGRPTFTAYQRAVTEDETLANYWVGNTAINGQPSDVEDAIMSAASCCKDANGRVAVEQVLLLLCCSPSLMRCRAVERALLLQPDSASTSEASEAVLLSALQSEGLCKALAVASTVAEDPTTSSGGGTISRSQYQWLLDSAAGDLPPVMNGIEKAFRPLFSVSDMTIDEQLSATSEPDVDDQGDSESKCVPSNEPTKQGLSTRVVLKDPRGRSASVVEVVIEILDSIVKSGSSKVPFSV